MSITIKQSVDKGITYTYVVGDKEEMLGIFSRANWGTKAMTAPILALPVNLDGPMPEDELLLWALRKLELVK